MGFKELLSQLPGMSSIMDKFSAKYLVESFSKRIIEHVKHPVDKYVMSINFKTGFIEFLIYHPGPVVPIEYKNPKNLMFKGHERKVPNDARLYDMDVKDKLDTMIDFISMQIPGFTGEVERVVLNVNRDSKEIPCEVYYRNGEEKLKLTHVLK